MQNGRTAIAPDMLLRAEVEVPLLLAVEVPAPETGRAKPGDDALAIGHWRRGAVRVGLVGEFLRIPDGAFLPEEMSIGAIETDQRAASSDGLGHVDAVFPDNRGGVTRSGKIDFPLYVLG